MNKRGSVIMFVFEPTPEYWKKRLSEIKTVYKKMKQESVIGMIIGIQTKIGRFPFALSMAGILLQQKLTGSFIQKPNIGLPL